MNVFLVVEDDPDIRMLVRFMFSGDPDFEVSGEVADMDAAVQVAADLQPDLIILDNQLEGPETGLEGAPRLKSVVARCRIVLFSASEELRTPALAEPAIDAFLLKTDITRLMPLCRQLLGLP